jgi:hypothetical protein
MSLREELPTVEPKGGTRGRPSWRWLVAALLALVVALSGLLLWRASTTDTDGDGLTDRVESAGWSTQRGEVFRTDPTRADTDGDGLTDLDEAGAETTDDAGVVTYSGYSDPLRVDTDSDALSDGAEADAGLNPRDADVDGDTLSDGYEVQVAGTDPESVDTDGDGLLDGYEDADPEDQGLDPLVIDEQISTLTYVADFTKGALAGDFTSDDSLAWFAGYLAGAGSSSIPVVGQVVGVGADLRDALATAIRGDWVGAGFNALGAVPGGDLVAIPRKVAKFVERNPRRSADAAAMIMKAGYIPEWIKVRAARVIWPEWDGLVSAGADEKALLRLQSGRTDLAWLTGSLNRPGHIPGAAVPALGDGASGEAALARLLRSESSDVTVQARISTAGCGSVCGGDVRVVDVLVDGVAHEAKVGAVYLTPFVDRQISKDAFLVRTGQVRGAHWDFVASSNTDKLGPSKQLLDRLDAAGITYTIHLPAAA